MKNLLIALFLIVAVTGEVRAADVGTGSIKLCNSMAGMAGSIMKLRQNNVDISVLYDHFSKVKDADVKSKGFLFIKMSYGKHVYSTDKYKQLSVQRFKNKIFLSCISVK